MFTSQILLEVSSGCPLTGLHSGCGQKKARELSDKISLLLLPEQGVTADFMNLDNEMHNAFLFWFTLSPGST